MSALTVERTGELVRLYPVLGYRYATAFELVAVFTDMWPLIGSTAPEPGADWSAWLRASAAELWGRLTYGETCDAVEFLKDDLARLDTLPAVDRAWLAGLVRRLALAFGFASPDLALSGAAR